MEIDCVASLLEYTSRCYFVQARGRWVFRGHSDVRYALVPSVGRHPHTSRSREKYEQSPFDIFRREAHGYLAALPTSDWEWLSLAQHHGLPTRLLDWTYNPLVALYFAVRAQPTADGEIYALNAVTKASEQVRAVSLFAISQPVKLFPNIVTPRIRAQEGLFACVLNSSVPWARYCPRDGVSSVCASLRTARRLYVMNCSVSACTIRCCFLIWMVWPGEFGGSIRSHRHLQMPKTRTWPPRP